MKYRITQNSQQLILGSMAVLATGLALYFGTQGYLKHLGGILACSSVGVFFTLVQFYRDPERQSSAPADRIVAPADGRILKIETVTEGRYLKSQAIHIAIFMHIGNVHVQRIPSDGKLIGSHHQPGKLLPVLDPRAAIQNEQQWYSFEQPGRNFVVVQIAGFFAKRTMNWLQPLQCCQRGERLGMIALGSEVDVYLSPAVEVLVKKGDKVRAGETIIGRWTA